MMARLKENKARERRIEMEAVVDAYNSEERRCAGGRPSNLNNLS